MSKNHAHLTSANRAVTERKRSFLKRLPSTVGLFSKALWNNSLIDCLLIFNAQSTTKFILKRATSQQVTCTSLSHCWRCLFATLPRLKNILEQIKLKEVRQQKAAKQDPWHWGKQVKLYSNLLQVLRRESLISQESRPSGLCPLCPWYPTAAPGRNERGVVTGWRKVVCLLS